MLYFFPVVEGKSAKLPGPYGLSGHINWIVHGHIQYGLMWISSAINVLKRYRD